MLAPAFHFKILQSYPSIYNNCIDILINKWQHRVKEGKSFQVMDDLSFCTFDVIFQSACSIYLNLQTSSCKHRSITVWKQNPRLCEGRVFQSFTSK